MKSPLSGVVRVRCGNQLVLHSKPNCIRTGGRGEAVSLAERDLVAKIRADRRHNLPLIERNGASFDSQRWTRGRCCRRRRHVVAVDEVASPIVLELELGAERRALLRAQGRKGYCASQVAARCDSIHINDAERQWIVERARSRVGRRLELAPRDLTTRCQTELRLRDGFPGCLSDGQWIGQPWVGVELRARDRARIVRDRRIEAEPLETVGALVVVVRQPAESVRCTLTRVVAITLTLSSRDVA